MIERYRGGVIPPGERNEIDKADAADYAAYHRHIDGGRGYLLSEALKSVWQTVMRANEYVDRQAPWKLAKDESAAAELDHILASLARQLVRQAVYLAPFTPGKAQELWRQIGGPGSVHDQRFTELEGINPTGWRVTKGAPLFPKEAPAKTVS